jgi:hypothetical protein
VPEKQAILQTVQPGLKMRPLFQKKARLLFRSRRQEKEPASSGQVRKLPKETHNLQKVSLGIKMRSLPTRKTSVLFYHNRYENEKRTATSGEV